MAKARTPNRRHAKVDRARVDLGDGHYIELTVAVDLFDLSEDDRRFVFGIIDRFNAWRAGSGEGPAVEAAAAGD